jgi:hypothetical protein
MMTGDAQLRSDSTDDVGPCSQASVNTAITAAAPKTIRTHLIVDSFA